LKLEILPTAQEEEMEKALPELNLHAAPMNPQPPQQDEEGRPSIEDLWATALEQDRTFNDIEGAIEAGSRASPPELKLQVTIAECSLDDKGKSRFRERLWALDYEPIRTRIIQDTYDSAVTSYPGRDLLVSILSRRFYWSGLSQDEGTPVDKVSLLF
jgi:hypothetical protein